MKILIFGTHGLMAILNKCSKFQIFRSDQYSRRYDILNCEFITELTLLPIFTLLPNFGGLHRTLQQVRLANRGRLLLRIPGPVPF